jgi:hypothetical protein
MVGIEGEPGIIREVLPDKTLLDILLNSDVDELSADLGAAPKIELKYSIY